MKVLYTAIFDGVDLPGAGVIAPRGWRRICFTDGQGSIGWRHREGYASALDATQRARYHKLLAHKLFPRARYSLWMDGNISLRSDLPTLLATYLSEGCDIAVHRHPRSNCLFDEVEYCISHRKENPEALRRQAARYHRAGVPSNAGLFATGVLLRRHSREMNQFCDAWWQEIQSGTRRDELSFSYLLHVRNLQYRVFDSDIRRGPLFRLRPHAKPTSPWEDRPELRVG